jgi:hypothetical protein
MGRRSIYLLQCWEKKNASRVLNSASSWNTSVSRAIKQSTKSQPKHLIGPVLWQSQDCPLTQKCMSRRAKRFTAFRLQVSQSKDHRKLDSFLHTETPKFENVHRRLIFASECRRRKLVPYYPHVLHLLEGKPTNP